MIRLLYLLICVSVVPTASKASESLDAHESVRAAFSAAEIDPRRWPSFEKALASLAASDFLVGVADGEGAEVAA